MVGAIDLPVGAVGSDDAYAKLSARTLRWRIILIRAPIAFPGNVGVGDHLQTGRVRFYARRILFAIPIVRDGVSGLEVSAVPLYGWDPVSGLVVGVKAFSSVRILLSGSVTQTGVSGIVFGGAVTEEVVPVGRTFLAGVDNRVVVIVIAPVA
jgi:hypothetical protein